MCRFVGTVFSSGIRIQVHVLKLQISFGSQLNIIKKAIFYIFKQFSVPSLFSPHKSRVLATHVGNGKKIHIVSFREPIFSCPSLFSNGFHSYQQNQAERKS
jgi:hypothetical protein